MVRVLSTQVTLLEEFNLWSNGESFKIHKIEWWKGDQKLADIVTKNGREDKLIPGLGYNMVRLENW